MNEIDLEAVAKTAGQQYSAQDIVEALQNPFARFVMLLVFRIRKLLGFIKRRRKKEGHMSKIDIAKVQGYIINGQLLHEECVNEDDLIRIKKENVLTMDNTEVANKDFLFFCDKCGERVA